MANIHTLLDAIVEAAGKKIRVDVINRSEHETIRTRLVTLWNQHKEAILAIGGDESDPLYPLSLCAEYCEGSSSDVGNTSQFWLGKSRKRVAKSYSFSIVEATESSATLDKEAVNEPQSPQLRTA